MDIIITIAEAVFRLLSQVTGSLAGTVPGGDVDCSQWVAPEVRPDGTAVEWLPRCGQEHWLNPNQK